MQATLQVFFQQLSVGKIALVTVVTYKCQYKLIDERKVLLLFTVYYNLKLAKSEEATTTKLKVATSLIICNCGRCEAKFRITSEMARQEIA